MTCKAKSLTLHFGILLDNSDDDSETIRDKVLFAV